MQAVRTVYGFEFPAELASFHEFWEKNAALCACLRMTAEGPLAVLAGTAAEGFDPAGGWPRYYLDPPEFFTVLTGHTDGLHWGVWFDDTADTDGATTASYFHNDGLNLRDEGSIFEAFRTNLELFHRNAEDGLIDDPDPNAAGEYRKLLDDLARLREAVGEFDLAERKETGREYLRAHRRWPEACARKPTAETLTGMGVVVPAGAYRPFSIGPLPSKPSLADVEARVGEARLLAESGAPGAALVLGHDLWPSREHHAAARSMLDLAYGALGREVLRDYLRRACDLRARYDRR